MKLSTQQVADNRERVLQTALGLFRERGFDGVSVADLMRKAGLTHGGFYNHFASKAELEAQACALAFDGSAGRLRDALGTSSPEGRRFGLAGYISRYLSRRWRDAPAAPCPMVAFSADVSRGSEGAGPAFAHGLNAYLSGLALLVADRPGDPAARRHAVQLASTLVGAMTLARSVARSNPALSDEILATVRDELLSATMDESGDP